ncbi:LLM class flavin-dependent oxidoreductase [Actinomadura vinacea]|uniref:LLM class flavin-dependent oxidoreductase n=1 Tax=Actinomadura vinacea TaxID=115336 RepID=A0ABN3IQF1_9ACTN
MAPEGRALHLNAFIQGVGHHEAAWRHPETDPGRLTDVRYFQEVARVAERGLFDSVFFADALSLTEDVRYQPVRRPEPVTLLAAIAVATERIGLIATASTTFTEPYNLARQFASVDHISGGRAGWNIVTSSATSAAYNFGLREQPAHHDRYVRADEFIEVVTKLWDSWEDDAIIGDRAGGVYADPGKVHAIDHDGPLLRVRGPLNVPRSPQGRPVLVQAGSSEEGRDFAARHAEAIFTAQQDLGDAIAFATDVRRRAAASGRDPGTLRILPGLSAVIGDTEEAAQARGRELDELAIPDYGLLQLRRLAGVDLSGLRLDAPVPPGLFNGDDVESSKSRRALVAEIVRRERPTVRGLLRRLAGARGHRVVAGTPEQIADQIQTWFEAGAADGFNIMAPYLPGGLELFVDHVVPELRRRGLFRTAYEGSTLREHYGLPRPASRYATPDATLNAAARP